MFPIIPVIQTFIGFILFMVGIKYDHKIFPQNPNNNKNLAIAIFFILASAIVMIDGGIKILSASFG